MVAESLLSGVEAKGDELWAHCPFHSERTPGGAFSYNPELDAAKCMSCGTQGDLIAIYCALQGYALDSADGFREFRDTYAKDTATRNTPRPASTPAKREWSPKEIAAAPTAWHERAGAFVEHSCERLEKDRSVQEELAEWGISMETARACRIGWNNQDKAVPRPAWGLPELINQQTGKPKKLWLPKGLVLPMFAHGRVVKIKIRRPEPATSWGADLRYWEVPGGENNRFHVYGRPEWRAWVLVETERDAVLVWQSVRHLRIGAMGMGGAAKRPAGTVADILRGADLVLLALDTDNAGAANSWKFWIEEFPQAIRWPVPPSMGKDVGDAVRDHGLDVGAWVRAGIPSHVWRTMEKEMERARSASAVPDARVEIDPYDDKKLPEHMRELLGIIRDYPFQLAVDRRMILVDQLWARTSKQRWSLFRRASWLLEHPDVHGFLEGCGETLVTAKNLDSAVATYHAAAEDVPGAVREMHDILRSGPITIERDTLRVDYDITWSGYRDNWNMICRLSNELLVDDQVLEWIGGHPAEVISAGNFWGESDAMDRRKDKHTEGKR
jgi:hypothetical protein